MILPRTEAVRKVRDEELEAAEATDMVPEDGEADQDAAGQE